MDTRFRFFAPSPNVSGASGAGRTNSGSTSSNATVRPNIRDPASGSSTSKIRGYSDSSRINSVRRILPSSPIGNPQIHDLVFLASSVEPMSSALGGHGAHHAGHVADTVCRYPNSIIGRGATFTAKKIQVPCECLASGHVVVKTPRVNSRTEDAGSGLQKRLKHMLFEIRVLSHEPLMFHENVIQMLGITWEDDLYDPKTKWPGLVLEYADAGTLAEAIIRDDIPSARRLKLCFDVGKGLSALHECGIIHSDVKAENVLLCTDEKLGFIAKIADFGFSLAEAGDGARLPGGTVPWNAPEWLEWIPVEKLSKTDIYSFGLLVWKVMTKAKNPFQDGTLGSTSSTTAQTDMLKASDARMLHSIASHLRRHLSQAIEHAPTWAVIECTVRKDPQGRNLSKALEIMEKAIPEEYRMSPAEGRSHDLGDMCREVWKFVKENHPDFVNDSNRIRLLCGMLTGETNISNGELGELQRENGDRIDETFFERFCELASQKTKARGRVGQRRVDEIRVLLPATSNKLSKHLNPDMVALEFSKFSANHIRMLHPDVQDMVYRSLVQSSNAGSADAALYLSIFHTNILFDSSKACEYILRAAKLGSSSAMYLCYRIHKAHGIPLPMSQLDLGGWFHTGICWGSQIAYQDAIESDPSTASTAAIILKQQGSCYGDTPFRESAIAGPFNVLSDDFTTTTEKIRSLNQHIDDITIAGDNGDKLLHWAAAMHQSLFQTDKGLLTAMLTEGRANVNVRNAKGETPILVAMRAGNGAAVGELLKFQADPSIKSNSGQVPLHWIWTLAEYSSRLPHENEYAMEMLCIGLRGGSRSVLHSIADTVSGRVNGYKEIEHSARLQSYILSDLPAGTPLHWAVQRRCIPAVNGLLAAGASPSICAHGADTVGGSGHGYALSPFHLAAAMHDDDILKLFLQKKPDGLKDLRPCALAVAIDGNVSQGYANGRFERMARHGPHYQARAQRTVQLFWDHNYREMGYGFHSGQKGVTPLLLAVQSGQTDVVEAILNTPFKKDLETRGSEGNNTPLQESIKRRCDDVYFLLRSHGADVSSTWGVDDGGHSNLALLAAVGHNRLEVAKDLIEAGIQVRSQNPSDLSPFALAVNGALFPLARFLLDNGASPNEVQDRGVGLLALNTLGPPTTVLGCLVHECTSSKLLSLTWLLDEHVAGRLGEPLDPMVCPSMGFNVYHILAVTGEEGRDDDAVILAFRKLRAAFPEPSLLQGVIQMRESSSVGHMRINPLFLAVETSNCELVREMLDAGADPSHEVEGSSTIANYAQSWANEFEKNARNGTIQESMKPSDPSEIPRMLARRKKIAELLNP